MEAAAAPTWAELLGSNEWKGLLDPLNLSLRKLILFFGDMSQATYDAFIGDANSKYCGCSRYGMKSFFQKVFLPACAIDYQVIAFLYATPIALDPIVSVPTKLPQTNWMGYIAVTKDEVSKKLGRREVYVVWRGTSQPLELITAFQNNLVPATPIMGHHQPTGNDDDDVAKVMEGWLTIYTSTNPLSRFTHDSAQTQVLTKMRELMEKYKNEHICLVFLGHGLGGVLASLSAINVVASGIVNPDHVQVATFVYGCPMLGNKAFCDKLKALRILHVKNVRDIIPNYPGIIQPGRYAHAGIELEVDSIKSPFLNPSLSQLDMENRLNWHNLQGLLHVVDGWNGREGEFELKVKRSLALVNKCSNFLKDDLRVLKSWWVEKNTGMVLDDKGDWVEAEPFQEED